MITLSSRSVQKSAKKFLVLSENSLSFDVLTCASNFVVIQKLIMSVKDQTMEIHNQLMEKLPNEMLMMIFKAMNGKTLKDSMLVHPK